MTALAGVVVKRTFSVLARQSAGLPGLYAPRSELYATIVEAVDLVMQAGATEAELKIRGSGLNWLEGALRSRGVEL
jgi:hypothetical protein